MPKFLVKVLKNGDINAFACDKYAMGSAPLRAIDALPYGTSKTKPKVLWINFAQVDAVLVEQITE
jgi:hypothetical protein